jgi:hypothetical protein
MTVYLFCLLSRSNETKRAALLLLLSSSHATRALGCHRRLIKLIN